VKCGAPKRICFCPWFAVAIVGGHLKTHKNGQRRSWPRPRRSRWWASCRWWAPLPRSRPGSRRRGTIAHPQPRRPPARGSRGSDPDTRPSRGTSMFLQALASGELHRGRGDGGACSPWRSHQKQRQPRVADALARVLAARAAQLRLSKLA
jgi:hypothetical protein